MNATKHSTWRTIALSGLAVWAVSCGVGCQTSVGGQTLPSPYYLSDDVQYFAEGPEFKLSREAAAMEQYKAEQGRERLGAGQ